MDNLVFIHDAKTGKVGFNLNNLSGTVLSAAPTYDSEAEVYEFLSQISAATNAAFRSTPARVTQ